MRDLAASVSGFVIITFFIVFPSISFFFPQKNCAMSSLIAARIQAAAENDWHT